MSGKVLVETTVLTNLLLKTDATRSAADTLLKRYSEVIVPQFAWKEFKRGPLTYFVWAHNKLKTEKTLSKFLLAVSTLSRTPQRYRTSTSLEAAASAIEAVLSVGMAQFATQYGSAADPDTLIADTMRLKLRERIEGAWTQRAQLHGGPRHRLECYPDEVLVEERDGRLSCNPSDCPRTVDCCLRPQLKAKLTDVTTVRQAIPVNDRKEDKDRRAVLKQIKVRPDQQMTRGQCRSLGDAYFVLFCPAGAEVATTNMKDIEPIAKALNIVVVSP